MARYSYAINSGWNVALVSLVNPEDRAEFMILGNTAPPTTQPVNLFPVRRIAASGAVRGFGRVDHVWTWPLLPQAAVQYLETLLFSSGTVVSAQVTINTRKQNTASYARYNAYAELFLPDTSYTYDRTMFRNVQLQFRGLVAI